jgi:Spy/CpxP family protein refolding chaperone
MVLIDKKKQPQKMKTHNFISILFFGASLALGQLVAQTPSDMPPLGPPPHGFSKPNITEMLAKTLDLTDAQKAQVKSLADAIQPQLDAIRQQAHDAESTLIAQLNVQIRPLLTADQQAKLDALETLRKGKLPPQS